MESAHAHRKDEHLAITEANIRKAGSKENFADLRIIHDGLPELAVADTDISVNLADFKLPMPFYIEAMTGGSFRTGQINGQLAQVAKETQVAMAVGSQSITLKDKSSYESFEIVRKVNPDGFIFANLGAGKTAQDAQFAIDLINANALEIHINVAQEIVMPEGDRNFNWLEDIAEIVRTVNVPVIVKEVGFGISQQTLAKLAAIGVQYVNVGGRGGTNFAAIENQRNHDTDYDFMLDWGQTTLESLIEGQLSNTDITLFATGGINNPLDILKTQIMGAKMTGVAGHFLHTLLTKKEVGLTNEILTWQRQLHELYALVGAKNQADLAQTEYLLSSQLANYRQQRTNN
ncbi:type 2 isopentenyl-diphosphate Delta-isomerase [Periweissella fabaria]|uniref:Isopentenyl-diphosphate delta-isomerase n=1 Tax=Periweissella fabaria TaxID=546157 RepID=A0ABM8Z8C8_9LACO|nr:type 2 isopentenyl-diphosphate Delta-isomerase [Periweissella fabaria]MCM0597111.1 type 2 isopentenyl-diphosphate Delta-isomerase [Periweissella fabaria]CAH0417104.1 Isopentenyl-diphosphate delta-isomerase [Periweissella fabaria]